MLCLLNSSSYIHMIPHYNFYTRLNNLLLFSALRYTVQDTGSRTGERFGV